MSALSSPRSERLGTVDHPSTTTRRGIFSAAIKKVAIVGATGISSIVFHPQSSKAATPMTPEMAETFQTRLERKTRKKPPKILRPNLSLDFAVLLMRSSYNAMDDMDVVAMDQFQKDFFFIRQAEYLPYVESLGPGLVRQGELVDPYYFDFISFAQYATISRDLIDAPIVFEEQQGITVVEDEPQVFVAKVIKRDPSLQGDVSFLRKKHEELVGVKILDKLNETFEGTKSEIPKIQRGSSATDVLASLKQLTNLFLLNGFAWDGKVELVKDSGEGVGSKFEITLTAPATLWSGQALQLRKAKPLNDFMIKTARIFLARSGYQLASNSVKYTSTQEISTFTII